MASLRHILPLLTLLLVLLVSTSEAREFVVGGNNCSWEISSPTPGSDCLNKWAKANRFRVGDTLRNHTLINYKYSSLHIDMDLLFFLMQLLSFSSTFFHLHSPTLMLPPFLGPTVFEYDPEDSSVLRVTKDAYEKCNITAPMAKYDDGKTKLELNQSGSFYFIGGQNRDCELEAQKLTVTVVPHEALHLHLKHMMMRAVQAPTPNPNPTTPSALMAPSPNGGEALGLKSGFMATLVGVGTVMWMVLF
ncbi:Early nodulin-like protein 3 [Morella rubra]|uniref:Early nodulin-like protein 3 n=1 Tax=Morella rubra TaxID=262757 RepID=A0A6A1V021_9ROSI|nr:Early nodulin-like protein 3 [Morella rubra]